MGQDFWLPQPHRPQGSKFSKQTVSIKSQNAKIFHGPFEAHYVSRKFQKESIVSDAAKMEAWGH